jgi:GntR family transcriptional regulator, transcriptional repressor for pyruvate dehydrogenase complex
MFSPVKSKKVYEIIIEQIQSMIIDGKLRNGDRLPSESALA